MAEGRAKRYSDEEQAVFVELAQEIGVARAIRELGYPTFAAGLLWLKKRGIEQPKSDIMAVARAYSQFYKVEDLLSAVDSGMAVVEELFAEADSADDAKKLAEAMAKLANTRLLLEGKANSITESRKTSPVDVELMQMIEEHKQNSPSYKSEDQIV